jgi:hypothetical protein
MLAADESGTSHGASQLNAVFDMSKLAAWLACVVISLVTVLLVGCSPFDLRPEHIVVADPQAFVREAEALIQKRAARAGDQRDRDWIDEEHLPEALRIRKVAVPRFMASVREAQVEADHLDLVLFRHTDGYGGARVWAAKELSPRDTKTQYRDIYLFNYSKELPTSPDNIP